MKVICVELQLSWCYLLQKTKDSVRWDVCYCVCIMYCISEVLCIISLSSKPVSSFPPIPGKDGVTHTRNCVKTCVRVSCISCAICFNHKHYVCMLENFYSILCVRFSLKIYSHHYDLFLLSLFSYLHAALMEAFFRKVFLVTNF